MTSTKVAVVLLYGNKATNLHKLVAEIYQSQIWKRDEMEH